MSYLDLARRLRGSEPDDTAQQLDEADCVALVRETFEVVAADYIDGALTLLDTDPDLCRRFHDTEATIDAAVKAGPTEPELRAALAAHVAVIRECIERKTAQREAAAERADDQMPEFSYGESDGDWLAVTLERHR